MKAKSPPQLEDQIARCRLFLSVVALLTVFVDPTAPFVSEWFPIASGGFVIDPWVLTVMGTHLVYSGLAYLAASRHWLPERELASSTLLADVVLGSAIAFVTEGATSPFFPFFAFAVVVAGFRSGMRLAMAVTAVSVPLYMAMILISAPGNTNLYIMRPVYLAIVGYLVGYLGQKRIEMQDEIRQLEAAEQRHRIARDLHDGFAQALAGVNLRIESCRRLLGRQDSASALSELTELQKSIHREYDDLRAYMQSLAGIEPSPVAQAESPEVTRFRLAIDVDGSIDLVDHVLQIAREGLSNVRRHSTARSAQIEVKLEGSRVRLAIDDDGVGTAGVQPPWSIASRVKELGGQIQPASDTRPGSHLRILLPQS